MGCDGGTIPRRDELVRVKKKPEQVWKKKEGNSFILLQNIKDNRIQRVRVIRGIWDVTSYIVQ